MNTSAPYVKTYGSAQKLATMPLTTGGLFVAPSAIKVNNWHEKSSLPQKKPKQSNSDLTLSKIPSSRVPSASRNKFCYQLKKSDIAAITVYTADS